MFKQFLENFSSPQNKYSWLDSSGTFHPVSADLDHIRFAQNITGNILGYNDFFKKGYLRITYMGKILYANNPFKTPNDKQKRNLIDLAIFNDMDEIIFDNDKNDFSLWKREK